MGKVKERGALAPYNERIAASRHHATHYLGHFDKKATRPLLRRDVLHEIG